jgi:hypothetical protein
MGRQVDGRGNFHGSAGTPNAGRFEGRLNTRQRNPLDPASWPPESRSDDVTQLREVFAKQLKKDIDLGRAIEVMERQGIDFRVYDPSPEQIANMVKEAIVSERWRDTPASNSVLAYDVRDVTTMGGDEIRALTPRQRKHLLSQAVQAANRLQSYMGELDEDPDESSTQAQEAPDGQPLTLTDAQLERAWQHYLANFAEDYEAHVAGPHEFERFDGHVQEAVRAIR